MTFSMYTIQNQGQLPRSAGYGVQRVMADTSGEDVTVFDYARFRVYELPAKTWESLHPKQVEYDHQYIVDHIAKAMQGGRRIPPVARIIYFEAQTSSLTEEPLTEQLLLAAEAYLAIRPAFRSKPVGAPGSEARRDQDNAIDAEDHLRAIINKVRKLQK